MATPLDEMTDAELEAAFPRIKWREPIEIHRALPTGGAQHGYACRFCIAHLGFGPTSPLRSEAEIREHLRSAH